jgi:hypothetical protein
MEGDMDIIRTTGPDVDVIRDLFGDISLVNLTNSLDSMIDDILWKLKEPVKREASTVAAPQGSPPLDTSSLSTTALVQDIDGSGGAATRANQGDMDIIRTTGLDVDVIHDLFGDVPLVDLTIGLDSVIDDILWKLKEPLGDMSYFTIRKSQQPATALIYALYTSAEGMIFLEARFVTTFWAIVLYFIMLVLSAKEEVIKREAFAIAAPQLEGPEAIILDEIDAYDSRGLNGNEIMEGRL